MLRHLLKVHRLLVLCFALTAHDFHCFYFTLSGSKWRADNQIYSVPFCKTHSENIINRLCKNFLIAAWHKKQEKNEMHKKANAKAKEARKAKSALRAKENIMCNQHEEDLARKKLNVTGHSRFAFWEQLPGTPNKNVVQNHLDIALLNVF